MAIRAKAAGHRGHPDVAVSGDARRPRAYRGRMEPEELAGAIKRLVEWAEGAAPQPEPPVRVRLREHFGCDPGELPVVSRPLESWDRPNLQVALDAWLADKDSDIIGVGFPDAQ